MSRIEHLPREFPFCCKVHRYPLSLLAAATHRASRCSVVVVVARSLCSCFEDSSWSMTLERRCSSEAGCVACFHARPLECAGCMLRVICLLIASYRLGGMLLTLIARRARCRCYRAAVCQRFPELLRHLILETGRACSGSPGATRLSLPSHQISLLRGLFYVDG